MADIFASVHLNLETGEFEANAAKAADKAGASMGSRVGSKLKTALGGAIGAMGGVAFAAVLQGAQQLDAATRQLQSDTGMTATEAGVAEKALAGMYQHNLQGFDQIGAAMGVVVNGLDLTGAAATAMTEKFLAFATATGQEAAPAVSSFHELLNAWSLDASKAPAIMDLLVASHQKYGSSVTDNEDALRKLAPQMIALGMSVEDTVGLLNLFDVAGMDSSKAMFALNTAVKNLRPGQTLNDLIVQVSSIKDPTDRAQEAIKLFGARGGVNLANALKPGITSLDQFKTSADENADATTRAADAVKSGFGNQAVLILHNFGGALSDLATNFGPLLMVAAVAGPSMMRLTGALVGGLAGMIGPRIAGAILGSSVAAEGAAATVGTASGTAMGGAMGAAAALVIPGLIAAGIAAAGVGIALAVDKMAPGVSKTMHDDFFSGLGAVGRFFSGGDWKTEVIAPAAEGGAAAGEAVASGATDAIASGITAAAPSTKAAMEALTAQAFAGRLGQGGITRLRDAGGQVPGEIAKGILAHRDGVTTALDDLTTMMKNSLSVSGEIARLAGQLTSKQLAEGLRDRDPAVRAQAQATKELIIARLRELGPDSKTWGKEGAALLAAGLKSKDPDIRAAALSLKGIVDAGLSGVPAAGAAAGQGAVDQLAAWLQSPAGKAKVLGAIQQVAGWISVGMAALKAGTPVPVPAATTTANAGATVKLRAAGGPVEAGMPYLVNENTPRSEWFIPSTSGTILTPEQMAGLGGPTYNITVPVQGLMPARSPEDIARPLRQLAQTGYLTRQPRLTMARP